MRGSTALNGEGDQGWEAVGMTALPDGTVEAAQSLLIARLHRRSDDFGATTALSSVSAALSRIGWEMPSVAVRRRHWIGRRS